MCVVCSLLDSQNHVLGEAIVDYYVESGISVNTQQPHTVSELRGFEGSMMDTTIRVYVSECRAHRRSRGTESPEVAKRNAIM